MKKSAVSLALSLLLLMPAAAHAEGYGASLYASYSVNRTTGAWGFAIGRDSSNAAYNDARNACRRTGCSPVLEVYANCVALFVVNRNGRRTFAAGSGDSVAAAENAAKRKFTSQQGVEKVHSICTR